MIKPQNSNRGGLIGIAVMWSTIAAIQGCSLSGAPGSSLHGNADDPVVTAPDRPTSRPDWSANAHIGGASWYGPGFNGKKTASGDIFDESKFTAAHRTMPLGRKARVTHLGNGKSVEVLINDRGPYIDGRVIDLSRAAAKALGIMDEGVVKVQVQLLQEAMATENVQNVNRQ